MSLKLTEEEFSALPHVEPDPVVPVESAKFAENDGPVPTTVGTETEETEETRKPIGRPPLTEEEKAKRAADRKASATFGDLFENEDPPSSASASPNGESAKASETGEATKIPKRAKKGELDALAEIVTQNQYGIVGFLLDPVEANPLSRIGGTEQTQGTISPEGLEIHAQLKAAWSEYLRSQGVEGVSPGTALMMIEANYFFHVIRQPKSQERLAGYVVKLRDWINRNFFGSNKKE